MHYFIRQHFSPGNYRLRHLIGAQDLENNIYEGIRINQQNELISSFEIGKSNIYPDFPMADTFIPIVSDRFKKLLSNLPDHKYLEFVPIKISPKRQNITKYFALNILENIPCFDWDKSQYNKFSDDFLKKNPSLSSRPAQIDKLVFVTALLANRNIFRMAESPTPIFVSDYLKKMIEDDGLIGIKFMPIEDFEQL